MVEVTESDKQAAKKLILEWQAFTGDMTGDAEQAFATHRIEAAKAERDRIVAWLRDKADDHKPFGTTQGDPTGCVLSLAADALESKP